jgi:hypothetical protein
MALDIRQAKSDLAERIKRRLGHPVIKVELDPSQLYDAIDYARDKWVKWAVGQARVETFMTVLLSAGKVFYDLPIGVTEVVDYDDRGAGSGGINTLFTIENFLFNRGIYNFVWATGGYDYSFVSYHLSLDYLKTIDKYTPTAYNYKYHPYTNQLEVHPPPPSGHQITVPNGEGGFTDVDSPGFLLLRTYMIEGSHYSGMESNNREATPWKRREDELHSGNRNDNFYTSDWIFDYSLAECKIILGRIRSKFAGFTSIGNTGIDLDGGDLISEGKEEKLALDETLRLEEVYDGYPIFWG